MSEEIKTSHFKTMEELLEHLKMWERDDDYEAYCRFFDYECAYAMAHYIDKLQKDNKKYIDTLNATEKIMNGQERTKDKLLKENVELQKENEELKSRCNLFHGISTNFVNKDIIRYKIKELEEEYEEYKGGQEWEMQDYLEIQIDLLKELLGE